MRRNQLIVFMCVILSFMLGHVATAQDVPPSVSTPTTSKTETLLKQAASLSESEKESMLAAYGLPKPEDFTWGKVLAWVIFGGIGFVAFMYGKKNSFWRAMVIGLLLMTYPYAFKGSLMLWLVGSALTVVLFIWKD